LTNTVPLTLYSAKNYDATRKERILAWYNVTSFI